METLQLVLYYSKKVPKISNTNLSVEDFIKQRSKDGETNFDNLLDEYSKMKGIDYEVVTTWSFVDEDEHFVDNVLKIQQSPDFVEWDETTKNNINRVLLGK